MAELACCSTEQTVLVKKVVSTGNARYSSLSGPHVWTNRVVPRIISVPEWTGIFVLH
jgi:hypothetical protein